MTDFIAFLNINASITQQMEGAKNRIFGVFEAFLTYTRHKNAANMTLVKFCGVFAAAQIFAICVTFCANGAAKTPQVAVPQKRRKI